jgi:hypothetical protein
MRQRGIGRRTEGRGSGTSAALTLSTGLLTDRATSGIRAFDISNEFFSNVERFGVCRMRRKLSGRQKWTFCP